VGRGQTDARCPARDDSDQVDEVLERASVGQDLSGARPAGRR
jgi:hypothetical protein